MALVWHPLVSHQFGMGSERPLKSKKSSFFHSRNEDGIAVDGNLKFPLSQWLNFKLFGITYLVGKIKFTLFFFRVHWLSEIR